MSDSQTKILIIEDNPELVDMYKLKFSHEGFNVITASDGEEGILKAVEEKPDLILLDILMPHMDGWEVLKAIKNNTSLDSKIILLSNLGQQEQIDKAYKMGATAYFIKANHTPSEVVEKVKEHLEVKKDEAFILKISPEHYDYERFMQAVPDPAKASTCPHCFGDVILELIPNKTKGEGNWWDAHFICSKCKAVF